jgi:glycosyltransferase involved in cell wall biosynthesis
MEHGTPSIAWDIPGCNEQIVDGLTGSLVKFGDISAMAKATEQLLDNSDKYEKASDASRERFKQHDVVDYAPRLLKVLEQSLADKNSR